jgi:hypothetical protein
VGHGLPAAFAWTDDPAGWTWWDVLAAGWVHRPPGAVGGVALGLSGEAGLGAWYALAGPWGGDRMDPNDLRGVQETAAWGALLGALGLAAPGGVDPARDAVYVGALRGLPAGAGWTLFAPPTGAGVVGGAAPRAAGGVVHGEVLGWVQRAAARPDAPAAAALLGLSAPAASRALARAWRAVPARADGSRPNDPELQGILTQEEAQVDRGFALALAPPLGPAGAVAASLDRVMAQAISGAPAPFVGEGRWWWPTVREAVARAFRGGEADGGM